MPFNLTEMKENENEEIKIAVTKFCSTIKGIKIEKIFLP